MPEKGKDYIRRSHDRCQRFFKSFAILRIGGRKINQFQHSLKSPPEIFGIILIFPFNGPFKLVPDIRELVVTGGEKIYGYSYLAPVAPFNPMDFQQDVIIRAPLWAMFARPRTIGWHNPKRQEEGNLPHPPTDGE